MKGAKKIKKEAKKVKRAVKKAVKKTKEIKKEKFVACDFCPSSFSSRTTLHQHIAYIHFKEELMEMNGNEARVCSLCGKQFTEKYLAIHLGTTHKLLSKLLGKKPSSKKANAERKGTKLNCKECGKSMKDLIKLKKHLAEKHLTDKLIEKNAGMTETCLRCRKDFASPTLLAKHLIVNHKMFYYVVSKSDYPELFAPETVGKGRVDRRAAAQVYFQCAFCSHQTHAKSHVKYHVTRHFRDEVFALNGMDERVCKFCGGQFSKKDHLLVHVAFHHGKVKQLMSAGDYAKCFQMHKKVKVEASEEKDDKSRVDQPGAPKLKGILKRKNCTVEERPKIAKEEPKVEAAADPEVNDICSYCDERLGDKTPVEAQMHLIGHFQSDLLAVNEKNCKTCTFCGEDFEGLELLLHHLAISHKLLNSVIN